MSGTAIGNDSFDSQSRLTKAVFRRLVAPVKLPFRILKGLKGRVARLAKFLGSLPPDRKLPQETRQLLQERKRIQRSISDISDKLWSGFSQYAISELMSIVSSGIASAEVKALASYELTRFYVASKNYLEAALALRSICVYSPEFSKADGPRLLEIETAARLRRYKSARDTIEDMDERLSHHPDFRLSACNVETLQKSNGWEERARRSLNSLYAAHSVSLIDFDFSEPISPFRTLRTIVDKAATIESAEKVSVLITANNSEQSLRYALDSLLKQTWSNLEIVLVDDCSVDGTWQIVRDYARIHSNVVASRNVNNVGVYQTRNRALQLSSGSLIAVHNCDEWAHPDMLALKSQALLANPALHGTFSMACTASPDLTFVLRLDRQRAEFVHQLCSSIVMRREDVLTLGGWDEVCADADAEFARRAEKAFGKAAFGCVAVGAPLTIIQAGSGSASANGRTDLRSAPYGCDREYAASSRYFLESINSPASNELIHMSERTNPKKPFPCPNIVLAPRHRKATKYDILLVSDLWLPGGTRSCNTAYIDIAVSAGLRVGLFHWPRADLCFREDIDPLYRERNKHPSVDIITPEEELRANAVIFHHPRILEHPIDRFPRVDTDKALILVNQLPKQVSHQIIPYYEPTEVSAQVHRYLGITPAWVAISPLVRRKLCSEFECLDFSRDIWYPPFSGEIVNPKMRETARHSNDIISGRHCRDHWTKWPTSIEEVHAAYPVDGRFRVLGGARSVRSVLGKLPDKWDVLPFDSVSASEFLSGLDVYLNYNYPFYFEEFGRNVMEALAAGVPVVADESFSEVFGEAVIAAPGSEALDQSKRIVSDDRRRRSQIEAGHAFVAENCSRDSVLRRLQSVVS